MNKTVYILRHSDDLQMCRDIFDMFKNDQNVHLLEDNMNCFAYSSFIQQFDFVIASRFHAIVHAYKQKVPAIILGWASKYNDLAVYFKQEKYVFDISDKDKSEKIVDAVIELSMNYRSEAGVIEHKLEAINENNCIDICLKTI
jgi:colanic acid/amylovoran biosynthesis protein